MFNEVMQQAGGQLGAQQSGAVGQQGATCPLPTNPATLTNDQKLALFAAWDASSVWPAPYRGFDWFQVIARDVSIYGDVRYELRVYCPTGTPSQSVRQPFIVSKYTPYEGYPSNLAARQNELRHIYGLWAVDQVLLFNCCGPHEVVTACGAGQIRLPNGTCFGCATYATGISPVPIVNPDGTGSCVCPPGTYRPPNQTTCVPVTGPALRAAPQVAVQVYRDGRLIASGTIGMSRWNQAVQIANQLGSNASHFCSSTAYQATQSCRLNLYNVPDLRVVQVLQTLGLFGAAPRTTNVPLAPRGMAYGPPSEGDLGAVPLIFVRLQSGAHVFSQGYTTRSQLNRALAFVGHRSPVNTLRSSPSNPVVVQVRADQAASAANLLGFHGVVRGAGDGGQVGQRLPQCPLGQYWDGTKCVAAHQFPCPPGQVLYQNRCVICNTSRWPDGALHTGGCPTGAVATISPISITPTVTGCNCTCPTNTFWNTTTRSCTVALRAAPCTLNAHRDATGRCVCNSGYVRDASNRCVYKGVPTTFVPSCPPGQYYNTATRSCFSYVYGTPEQLGRVPAPIASGQLGNPASASVNLSIGVGGLILFGLAAYGLWRVARG